MRLNFCNVQIYASEVGERRCVKMLIDEKEYFLLTIKRNPMAFKIIQELYSNMGIEAVAGMAFEVTPVDDKTLSFRHDPTITGIYVPIENYVDVMDGFGK